MHQSQTGVRKTGSKLFSYSEIMGINVGLSDKSSCDDFYEPTCSCASRRLRPHCCSSVCLMTFGVTDGHSLVSRLRQTMLKGWGTRTIPMIPSMSRGCGSGGQEKWIRCRRDVMYRKSSVLARVSPRQTLGPDKPPAHKYLALYLRFKYLSFI